MLQYCIALDEIHTVVQTYFVDVHKTKSSDVNKPGFILFHISEVCYAGCLRLLESSSILININP